MSELLVPITMVSSLCAMDLITLLKDYAFEISICLRAYFKPVSQNLINPSYPPVITCYPLPNWAIAFIGPWWALYLWTMIVWSFHSYRLPLTEPVTKEFCKKAPANKDSAFLLFPQIPETTFNNFFWSSISKNYISLLQRATNLVLLPGMNSNWKIST